MREKLTESSNHEARGGGGKDKETPLCDGFWFLCKDFEVRARTVPQLHCYVSYSATVCTDGVL